MATVTLSPKATRDLFHIFGYTAEESPAETRRFVDNLIAQCMLVGDSPSG